MTAQPATSPLVLRRLSAADDLGGAAVLMAGYATEIRRNLFDGHGLKLEETTPDAGKLVEIAGLLEPPQSLYLAEVDGEPAGTCGLKQTGRDVAEIKRMYVAPALRGRGVARALLERVIADARAARYRTLQLETAVWMVEAHALYRSCGFVDAPPFPNPEFGCFPGFEHLARYMTLTPDETRGLPLPPPRTT
ncbi:MAG TPA: GNAT family N-acetyltransferase [Acidimicrobiia bacterium]|nr:GNAT family N-acetyltransferase [Acidimicrobiia bacterium]